MRSSIFVTRSSPRVALLAGAALAIVAIAGSLFATLARSTPAADDRPSIARPTGARDSVFVSIPGGDGQIGDDSAPPPERPAFLYHARPFLMDRTPVTVAQFRAFVRITRYVTDAERSGAGTVLDEQEGAWAAVSGADWRHPWGASAPPAAADHPVTQVSWRDADTFCRAYGARLPDELEWERAARLGQTPDGHVFKAGDPLRRGDHFLANVWNGLFPFINNGADGYRGTSPVGAFGTAPSGLTDMAGNVWEWTASWYVPYGRANVEPRGGGERVQRGGSFLCDPTFCQGFRATARGHAAPDGSFVHVGFRCVADRDHVTRLVGASAAGASAERQEDSERISSGKGP